MVENEKVETEKVGRGKLVNTEFGLVGKRHIEVLKASLEGVKEELEKIIRRCRYVIENWGEAEYSAEDCIWEICQFFNDCAICPVYSFCSFAKEGCYEVFNCPGCPRIRICLEKGSLGFLEYVKMSGKD
jgi:hypothetical protein